MSNGVCHVDCSGVADVASVAAVAVKCLYIYIYICIHIIRVKGRTALFLPAHGYRGG